MSLDNMKRIILRAIRKARKEGEMSEPSLIDITDDKEFMDRVLKKSAEMQEETLKKAKEEK